MLDVLPRTLVWQPLVVTDDLVAEYMAYQRAAGYAVDDQGPALGSPCFPATLP